MCPSYIVNVLLPHVNFPLWFHDHAYLGDLTLIEILRPATSRSGVSFVFLFTLELLENTASDNNVSSGVSSVLVFKCSRSEKIRSMAGVGDINIDKT